MSSKVDWDKMRLSPEMEEDVSDYLLDDDEDELAIPPIPTTGSARLDRIKSIIAKRGNQPTEADNTTEEDDADVPQDVTGQYAF